MAALSLSRLGARLRGRDSPRPEEAPPLTRPDGALVWVHASDPLDSGPLIALADRLQEDRPDATVLVTAPGLEDDPALLLAPVPEPRAAARFLAHWRPDAALWVGRPEPTALVEASRRCFMGGLA